MHTGGVKVLYIQFVRVLYCKLPTNSKQLPAFPLEVRPGFVLRSQRLGGESVTTLPPWPQIWFFKDYSSSPTTPSTHLSRGRGHGGRVVTLSPPTSEAGVRSRHGLKWESW